MTYANKVSKMLADDIMVICNLYTVKHGVALLNMPRLPKIFQSNKLSFITILCIEHQLFIM